jgi:hypothetical protein
MALTWLAEDGAKVSPALLVLVATLQTDHQQNLVIEKVGQGLEKTTQEALMAYLRANVSLDRSIFLLTRFESDLRPGSGGRG